MTDYITRLATLVDKETKQILEDSLDLIKQIKYMVGIAERGTGKKCPDGERPEAFLLAYVKSLEAALAQQDAQVVSEDEIVAAWKSGMTVQYFVTIGHDDEWTDYTNPTPPDTSGTRLAWRVKPGQRSNTAPTPPAQRVMLTDDEIDFEIQLHIDPVATYRKLHNFAHAVIEAYEIKNGLKP